MRRNHIFADGKRKGKRLILCCQIILIIICPAVVSVGIKAAKLIECKVKSTRLTRLSAEGDSKRLTNVFAGNHSVKRLNSGIRVCVGRLSILGKIYLKLLVYDRSELLAVSACIKDGLACGEVVGVINRTDVRILRNRDIVNVYLRRLVRTAVKISVVKTERKVQIRRCVRCEHIIERYEGVCKRLILGGKLILRFVGYTVVSVGIKAAKLVEGEVQKTCLGSLCAEGDNEGLACVALIGKKIVQRLDSRISVCVWSLSILGKVYLKLSVYNSGKLLTVSAGVNHGLS